MGSKLAAAAGVLAAMLVTATPAIGHGRSPDLQFRGRRSSPPGRRSRRRRSAGCRRSPTTPSATATAISDDQEQFQPTRFYTLGLDIRDGRLADGDVRFTDVTTLLAPNGQPYPALSLDPEGLVLTKDRKLIYTSEGIPAGGIDPFVRRAALDGSFRGAFEVPDAFLVANTPLSGVRPNLGFERGRDADGRSLFTANEGALYQDGPPATVAAGSPVRILRYSLRSGCVDRQWSYRTEPVAESPVPHGLPVNGVVELLPLNDDTLISMERSFSVGAPDTELIKLFKVELRGHGPQDAAARSRRPRHPARQRRGHDVRAAPAPRPPLARAGQRQQLRPGAVHTVPAVRREGLV